MLPQIAAAGEETDTEMQWMFLVSRGHCQSRPALKLMHEGRPCRGPLDCWRQFAVQGSAGGGAEEADGVLVWLRTQGYEEAATEAKAAAAAEQQVLWLYLHSVDEGEDYEEGDVEGVFQCQ